MAVCPVSFGEAYGEPGGPRLRATPFRSMGRRLQEEPEGQGLQKEPNEQITVQGRLPIAWVPGESRETTERGRGVPDVSGMGVPA